MLERIVVVPNSNKLNITLAYHNKNVFNTRILTPVELANEVLMRKGKLQQKTFVSKQEELAYFKYIIENIQYFKSVKLADITKINSTINTIRKLILEDEEIQLKDNISKGIFIDKNKALIEVYERYMDILNSNNAIDSIGLIREIIDAKETIDSEIVTIKELKLQPLENNLVEIVSSGTHKEISLFDLYEVEDTNIHIDSYKNCYGISNELSTIIDDIFKNKEADKCVIATSDYKSYSQILFDYKCKYNLPITFSEGLSISNSYPGKLLWQYYKWQNEGNFGWKPFLSLINSPYFNIELLKSLIDLNEIEESDLLETVSKLRISNNKDTNKTIIEGYKKSVSNNEIVDNKHLEKYINNIEILANEFSLPIEDFVDKYSVIRTKDYFLNKFDESAKSKMINQIKTIKKIGLDTSDDVVENILSTSVYKQANKPGHIHFTTIENSLTSLRDNLYVCGLSSSAYPGSPKENPLLLDKDLEIFNNEDLTSSGKINNKKNTLISLIKLATSLNNKIYLSYPGLNVSELKNNNASSLLYEIYQLENGNDKNLDDFKNNIINTQYFDPNLSISKYIGEAYNNLNEIEYEDIQSNNDQKTIIKLSKYSPSALNTFFNCKKQFFYQNILRIPVEDDYNPYEVIPATDQGTLVHALMEYLPDHKMSKEDFLKLGSDAFDEYLNISVPLVKEKIGPVKEQFLEMLENGWEFDNKYPRQLAFKEVDKNAIHKESGITIHGFPDRVELTDDGKAIIIDFKTERNINSHIKDDVDSCLQVLIYAYIVEQTMGLEIDHCEYRMLRYKNGIITCKYDKEIKEALANKLMQFSESIKNGNFDIETMTKKEEKDICKYCKYGQICGKVVIDE